MKLLLPCKSNKYSYFSVCVCARRGARVRVYVCVGGGGCPDAWACAFARVLVALLIQNATHMRLSRSTTFFDIISQTARFSAKSY